MQQDEGQTSNLSVTVIMMMMMMKTEGQGLVLLCYTLRLVAVTFKWLTYVCSHH
jgi:hypothetical protein